MFCTKCGVQTDENNNLCPSCKTKALQEQEITCDITNNIGQHFPIKKNYNIILLSAVILMVLGTLLPCYKVSMFGFSSKFKYIEGDGVFILMAAIAIGVMHLLKKDKFIYIPIVISGLLLLALTVNALKFEGVSFEIGFFIMWISVIVLAVLPFTPINKK